ncbi:hypothetical protein [Streptomyces cinerochromogenes]|uniref:hypothetical protein n=1 Tax=Streptomyces cinerochromogenes TaxID=66422 RepID=UPI001670131F|nr:hypothetical protein [Streptomyces cinerochromogenes]GGS84656.1 hypothetical protein GCM10010206_54180 [Streptomyces cinerochromogenes]
MTAGGHAGSPEEALWLGYAVPPFHPAYAYASGARGPSDAPVADPVPPAPAPARVPVPPSVRPRRRRGMSDGAAVSGLLAVLCVASLLAAIGLAAVRARC